MPKRLSVVDSERCVGCQCCMFACNRREGVGGVENSRIWVRSAGGIRRGFVAVVCRACTDPPCARVCPTRALSAREGGGVRFQRELCLACGLCRGQCPFDAIRKHGPSGKPLICTYCGICAQYCNYGVLKLQEIEEG
jgi:anaerobic carbon-monoxide dehydrogenase iron sulfur subunit